MSLDDLILTVFGWVDDELHAAPLDALRQRGPDPLLADREVITLELVGEYLGFDTDTQLFWYFRQHPADAFPGLALGHRTSFARQAANLWQAKQVLQQRLAERLAGPAADWLVDRLPVPVCRFGCGGFVRNFRGQAAFGYDGLQKQAYDGFRLHLRVSRDGVIWAYQLAPANASDLEVLPELGRPVGTTGIGDRNY